MDHHPKEMILAHYDSPIGGIIMTSDEIGITGIFLDDQRNLPKVLPPEDTSEHIDDAISWLDDYFSQREPEVRFDIHLIGTDFQKRVWNILRTVPYGKTVTYGEIARTIGNRMSAQAVGNAVSRNPVSIAIPCHRVIGSDGSLTGYAGGIGRKRYLLELESKGRTMKTEFI